MVFIKKEDLINRINRECFAHKNTEFDFEAYTSYWRETYISKGIYNFWGKATGYKWVKEKNSTSRDTLDETDVFFKSLFLPSGLTCSCVDVINYDETLSEPTREHEISFKRYDRKYIIHVSKHYCDNIVNRATSSKLFFFSEINGTLLNAANSFKDKIKCEHSDIVKEIIDKCGLNYTTIDREGVNIYSDYNDTIIFKKMGFKDFTEEYQVLGLALAIIDVAIPYLKNMEYFSLEYKRTADDIFSATIHKMVLPSPQKLNEW